MQSYVAVPHSIHHVYALINTLKQHQFNYSLLLLLQWAQRQKKTALRNVFELCQAEPDLLWARISIWRARRERRKKLLMVEMRGTKRVVAERQHPLYHRGTVELVL
jgi:hypothetical protein